MKTDKNPLPGEVEPGHLVFRNTNCRCVFLLSTDAEPGLEVHFVAVADPDNPQQWTFCNALPQSRASGFCRRLFVLAARCSELMAKPAWPDELLGKKGEKLLFPQKGEEKHARFLVGYLRDTPRRFRSETKKYGGVPLLLLKLAASVFGTHGRGRGSQFDDSYAIELKGEAGPESFVFGDANNIPTTLLGKLPSPKKGWAISELTAQNCEALLRPLDQELVSAIAGRVLVDEYLQSVQKSSDDWVNWYTAASTEAFKPFERDVLDLGAVEHQRQFEEHVQPVPDQVPQQPRWVPLPIPLLPEEILRDNHRVILTGEAGCGKTWTLKHLVSLLATNPTRFNGVKFLPVLIRAKDYDPDKSLGLKELIKAAVHERLKVVAEARQVTKNARNKTKGWQQRISSWLEVPVGLPDDLLLLVDGLDELSGEFQNRLEEEIQPLVRHWDGRVVVSVRSACATGILLGWHQFQIEPLTDEQIVNYLDSQPQLPDSGQGLFDDWIKNDTNILLMARTPFFLRLIMEYLTSRPGKPLPRTRANMIGHFVERCEYRKAKEEYVRKAQIESTDISYVLTRMAELILKKRLENAEEARLRYPDDFVAIPQSKHSVFECLDAAESHGIITFTPTRGKTHEPLTYVDFTHAFFLAYFVSGFLLTLPRQGLERRVMTLLKDSHWDESIRMLFERLTNPSLGWPLLKKVSQADLFFAYECAARSSFLTDTHINYLLKLIHNTPIRNFPAADSFGRIRRELRRLRHFRATVALLGRLHPEQVVSLFRNARTCSWIKAALPQSFLTVPEDKALQYLSQMLAVEQGDTNTGVFSAISELRSPKAYRFLVSLLNEQRKKCKDDDAAETTECSASKTQDAVFKNNVCVCLSNTMAQVPLEELLATHRITPHNCRYVLLQPMVHLKGSSISQVVTLLSSEDEEIRNMAIFTLGQLHCKEALVSLRERVRPTLKNIEATASSIGSIRDFLEVSYIRSLISLGDTETEQHVLLILERKAWHLDDSWPVAFWVGYILSYGTEIAKRRLIEMACCDCGPVSDSVAQKLLELSYDDVVHLLVRDIHEKLTEPTHKARASVFLANLQDYITDEDLLTPLINHKTWRWVTSSMVDSKCNPAIAKNLISEATTTTEQLWWNIYFQSLHPRMWDEARSQIEQILRDSRGAQPWVQRWGDVIKGLRATIHCIDEIEGCRITALLSRLASPSAVAPYLNTEDEIASAFVYWWPAPVKERFLRTLNRTLSQLAKANRNCNSLFEVWLKITDPLQRRVLNVCKR